MERVSAGIDLGTTNSCLAVLQGDKPVVVLNEHSEPVTPSVVSILPNGIAVGKQARPRLLTHPSNTFASIKRRMGERHSRTVLGREHTPESVSAMILAHLKECGERHVGGPIDDIVITVPAHFNSLQRQATKDAGEIAGFNVLRILNEPTAAALAYGYEHQLSSVLVVFDLGGGTFDISVVEAGNGLYEVLHSAGDNHLGGDDFNHRIVQWIVKEFESRTGIDIRRDVPAMCLVHEWAVAAKHALTRAPEVRVKIDSLQGGKSFDAVLGRAAFVEMCRDLFNRVRALVWQVSEELQKPRHRHEHPGVFENGLEGCDILLVGGETRVPEVRQLVASMLRGRIRADVNPDEAVALGAALQAGIIHRKSAVEKVVLIDTTALALGTAVSGEIFSRVIDANTRMPCTRTNEYVPTYDHQPAVVIGVYQGESELVAGNRKLGEIELRLDPPRPIHDAVIQVTFHLDADDILHVTARDKATGAVQEATIRDSQNLDRATVDRMRREARISRGQDRDEVERLRQRGEWTEWLVKVERRLRILESSRADDEHVQTATGFARQLGQAIRDGDDELARVAARDLEAALQDLHFDPKDDSPAEPYTPAGRKGACGNCGAAMPPGFAFCGKCGMPLKPDCCSACGASLMEGFAFCGKCGAKAE